MEAPWRMIRSIDPSIEAGERVKFAYVVTGLVSGALDEDELTARGQATISNLHFGEIVRNRR